MSSLRPLISRFVNDEPRMDVEALQREISSLCAERQRLRASGAQGGELEQNRLEIARLQWQLSHALIQRHMRPATA
jgi:hypothetical protein